MTSTAVVDDANLSDAGAHYFEGSWRNATFRYEVGSALPGAPAPPESESRPVPHGLAGQLARAADYVSRSSRLSPPLQVVATGVPAGVRRVDVQRFRTVAGAPLALPLAVRYVDGDERYARNAVRRVAHEAAHLVAAFHRRSERDEEWAAAVIESCTEHVVFGTTRGYVFRDELASPPASFDRAQRESVIEALRATRDVERVLRPDGAQSFRRLCDAAFARVRPRGDPAIDGE